MNTVVLLIVFLAACCFAQVCYGVSGSGACSGHGMCVSNDTCVCYEAYSGSNCSSLGCGWMSESTFGAPSPSVSLSVSGTSVVFQVIAAKKYGITHVSNIYDSNCADSVFISHSNDTCQATYRWTNSLQELIANANTSKVFTNGDVFDVTGNVFVSYKASGSCTTFKVPFTIRAYLQGTAFAEFSATKVPTGVLSQKRVFVDPSTGKMHILASLELIVPGTVNSLQFVSSSNNIPMTYTMASTNAPCGNENQVKCQYALEFVTSVSQNDYSGAYQFKGNLTTATQNVLIDVFFQLQYLSPLPPAVANVSLTTMLATYTADFAAESSSFAGTDTIWVLDSIQQSITIPTRKLAIQNAWLCCMANRLPLPETGCSVAHNNMTVHVALVSNETPLVAQWDTKLKSIPFIDTKAGFSFSALVLNDRDQFCFLQVNAFLKQKTRTTANDQASLTAYSPFVVSSKRVATPNATLPANSAGSISWLSFSVLVCLFAIW